MPSITPSDALSGGHRGLGMQIKLDPDNLRRLANVQAGDSFTLDYVFSIEGGGGMTAQLQVKLDDPNGLFAGHSIVAVLGNLVSQVIEARLSEPVPAPAAATTFDPDGRRFNLS